MPSIGGGEQSPPPYRGNVRKRKEIETDGTRKDILTLEVLLDIRELISKEIKKKTK